MALARTVINQRFVSNRGAEVRARHVNRVARTLAVIVIRQQIATTAGNRAYFFGKYLLVIYNLNQVILYPNPFSNSLNLVIKNVAQISNCTLIIYNVLGKEVKNLSFSGKELQIKMR